MYGCGPDEETLFRALAPRLGVLPTITHAPPSADNAALAAGHRCVSVGHKTPITHATLRALSRADVRYVSTRSVGFDHIDVDYAATLGIQVENVAYSPDSVADYTLMLMLMALRNARSVIVRAEHRDFRLHEVRGRELRDLTVGVVGTGRIGAAVIDRLAGFGCRVLAHDAHPGPAAGHVPLDELLAHSDIVTLHTPLNAGTHHLLDRRRIGQLPPGAIVVNTGRGPLVDTDALVAALEAGELGGAALDVVEGEEGIFYADCRDTPLAGTTLARLHQLPNVIVSPHTAYYTDHALRDTVQNSIANCLRFESRYHHG
ncbi:lactate dehydrogenase [Actinocatenispora thailandica]|uniref:Lactate dehydrogenase n=1 Tax=Actinocatenispora thailandica TaxID=227318 RepID=A0A7R7DLW4_9ACTN|nr:lactate dehydrogenase [Actinocatenispora thailandica]